MKKDDFLQPDNPRFKEVYGYDPVAEGKKLKKEEAKKKDNEKAKLEEKYWKMKKDRKIKPWDEKYIKRTVLEEKKW